MRRFPVLRTLAAALLLGAVAVARGTAATAQEDDPDAHPLVGAWTQTITLADGASFPSLLTVSDEGTVQVAGLPATAAADDPSLILFTSTGLGAWEATGPDAAVITFVHIRANQAGQFLATVTPHQRITVSADGQSFTGEFLTSLAAPDGTVLATLPGTLTGSRIVAEGPDALATPAP